MALGSSNPQSYATDGKALGYKEFRTVLSGMCSLSRKVENVSRAVRYDLAGLAVMEHRTWNVACGLVYGMVPMSSE